ncbi:unnamed protein product [Ascophyllum nodosum]
MTIVRIVAVAGSFLSHAAGMLAAHQTAGRISRPQASTLLRRSYFFFEPRYLLDRHRSWSSRREQAPVASLLSGLRSNRGSLPKKQEAGFVGRAASNGLGWRRGSTLRSTEPIGGSSGGDEHSHSSLASTGRQVAESGVVYVVATPIGNLEDITLRAINILRTADVIAAEDTRTTGRLLKLLGLEKAGKLISHHEHNTRRRVPEIVDAARNGKSVALVSDAGTPGFSDPGRELIAACATEGIRVVPVPGACAPATALSVSGFPSTEFVFFGFVGGKRGSAVRRRKLTEIAREPRTCILFESPHRIADTLKGLLATPGAPTTPEYGGAGARLGSTGLGDREEIPDIGSGDSGDTIKSDSHSGDSPAVDAATSSRPVVIARELTKLHEDIFHGTLSEAAARYRSQGDQVDPATTSSSAVEAKGEFTVVLGPSVTRGSEGGGAEEAANVQRVLEARLTELTAGGMSTSSAVKMTSKDFGLKKSDVYRVALALPSAEGGTNVRERHTDTHE